MHAYALQQQTHLCVLLYLHLVIFNDVQDGSCCQFNVYLVSKEVLQVKQQLKTLLLVQKLECILQLT